jgi:hypothetical protein
MRKLLFVFVSIILISIVQISCSSGGSATGTQPGDNTGSGSGTGATTSAWSTELSAGPSADGYYFPPLSVTQNIIETENAYITVVSTDSPLKSTIVNIAKDTGIIKTISIDGSYITGLTQDPDGNLLTLNQTGMLPSYSGSLTVFSSAGEKLKETVHPDVIMGDALATCDDGVVFAYRKSDGTPVLAKTDFDGNILWEKHYANELDSGLTGNEYISPGGITTIRRDVDGNLVVEQNIQKLNAPETDPSNIGYAIYKVTTAGELIWSRADYVAASSWSEGASSKNMMTLQDDSIIVEYSTWGNSPGTTLKIQYLDNQGDPIDTIFSNANSGAGTISLSTDQKLLYATREHDFETSTNKTVMHKLDLDGTEIWKRTYYEISGDDADGTPYPVAIHPCSDGGFLISATLSTDTANTVKIIFIKTDAQGNQQNNLDL